MNFFLTIPDKKSQIDLPTTNEAVLG